MNRFEFEEIIEEFCDDYCKFPSICNEEELMKRCENCPICILLESEVQG
jgi:hypothetical protein